MTFDLEPGMVFNSCFGIVRLNHRVPGDGSKWNVDTWFNTHFYCDDTQIEPSDLENRLEHLEGDL